MTEPDGILDILRQLEPLVSKANTLLSSEKMTLNHIRWGIENKEKQLRKIQDDIRLEEQRLEVVRDQAVDIVKQAKAEAAVIFGKAQQDRLDAAKLKSDAKLILEDAEKEKFTKRRAA